MKTFANQIVKHHKIILFLFILLAVTGGILMLNVNINTDMTKYLPDDSPAKQGVAILDAEFPEASTFTLMFEDLADNRKQDVYTAIQNVEGVQQVNYDDTSRYNNGNYTLYEITVSSRSASTESQATVDRVQALFPDDTLHISGDAPGNTAIDRLPVLLLVAGALLLAVLFLMGTSWLEPILFLITIGIAILLNMGTNIFFDSVSEITYSIAAVLQVVLSIDYSIMLLTRYRLEKTKGGTNREAMARALQNAFSSITGSSLTTIVGMLALTLMSFTIGMDLGLVLAKGVFFSLLCIFTVMPALVLLFNGALERTKKKTFLPKMTWIGSFAHKARYGILIVFVLLLGGSLLLRNSVNITYSMADYYEVNKHFRVSNPVMVLYENDAEAAVAPALAALAQDERVESVNSYAATMTAPVTADAFSALTGINPMIAGQLFTTYGADSIPLNDLLDYIQTTVATNPMYADYFSQDALAQLSTASAQFVGETHSRAIFNTTLPEESDETFALIADIHQALDATGADYLLVGNSAIAYEMHESFPGEMNRITLFTIAAIFLIVALVFRKLTVPLVLTLIIQCAVWITMGTSYLQGISMYYLPLLIVQCLLLGAMVDYGILYADYYREARKSMGKKNAVIFALRSAIHTILTSGLVLVSVTIGVGLVFQATDPSIAEILMTVSKGGAIAVGLIVFVLPGVLAALDRGKNDTGSETLNDETLNA